MILPLFSWNDILFILTWCFMIQHSRKSISTNISQKQWFNALLFITPLSTVNYGIYYNSKREGIKPIDNEQNVHLNATFVKQTNNLPFIYFTVRCFNVTIFHVCLSWCAFGHCSAPKCVPGFGELLWND